MRPPHLHAAGKNRSNGTLEIELRSLGMRSYHGRGTAMCVRLQEGLPKNKPVTPQLGRDRQLV